MKAVEDTDGDNLMNSRIRAFYDTDQVCKKISDILVPGVSGNHDPANPVGNGRYNISFSQCMKMTVLVGIIETNMATLESHFNKITLPIKTTFTEFIFICLFILCE